MNSIGFMSESEKEIMMIIWNNPHPITSKQIMEKLDKIKLWKVTTVQTFLSRLENKGILTSTKSGKQKLYSPALTAKQYGEMETQYFMQTVHNGSMKSFISTLSGGDVISKDELDELKKWILEQ